jgi:polyisoprenoid-binding protein YceI
MSLRRLASTLIAATLLPAAASAAEFRFDATSSELAFTGSYDGEPVPGVFRQFSGSATLDPAAPLATRFRTEIEVASLDTDYADRDEVLRAAEFFDAAMHPKAIWASDGDCRIAGPSLECPGTLTLKGRTHDVPVTITIGGDGRSVEGRSTLKRTAFDVGEGDWADPETVGDEIEVRFRLKLQ